MEAGTREARKPDWNGRYMLELIEYRRLMLTKLFALARRATVILQQTNAGQKYHFEED